MQYLRSLAVVALVVLMAAPALAAPGHGFHGRWFGVDADDSNMWIQFRPQRNTDVVEFQWYDDAVIPCLSTPAWLLGEGTLGRDTSGNPTLSGEFSVTCLEDPAEPGTFAITFTYDLATRGLTDDVNIIEDRVADWFRGRRGH